MITGATGAWSNGRGIFCNNGSPTITNNTISGNGWDGICCEDDSFPTITNNTITENGTTSTSYYGIYNDDNNPGNPEIDYNCVWGNGSSTTNNYYGCTLGLHDISFDPQFIGNGDYHLGSNSLCIDSGSNTAPGIPSKDKDGNNRIINGIVDIGAYEFQGTPSFTGSISGTVTDTLGNPISSVLVKVISGVLTKSLGRGEAITGTNGTFTITNLPFGTYTIRASYLSYCHSYRNVVVSSLISWIELEMPSTQTTILYVSATNTSGIENGSSDYPYHTIQRGIAACLVGGTISVALGTYTETVYINKRIALIGINTPMINSNVQQFSVNL